MSCADAIANVIEKYIDQGPASHPYSDLEHFVSHHIVETSGSRYTTQVVGQCPECGGPLIYQEGCNICLDCGFTKCG